MASALELATSANIEPAPSTLPNLVAGQAVDVAKYTDTGLIDRLSVSNVDSTQDTTFRIYNIFYPNQLLSSETVTTGEANSKALAAKLEI